MQLGRRDPGVVDAWTRLIAFVEESLELGMQRHGSDLHFAVV